MSKFRRLSNIDEAQIIEVIEVKSIVGDGTSEDPYRQITEYFSKEGDLLARREPSESLSTGIWEVEEKVN